MIEQEQAKESQKKFLCAGAIHSSHTIKHHMQQIMECQRVVDEFRNMVDKERDLIALDSSMFRNDLTGITHIMYMIDMDIYWHQKPFGAVLAELCRNCDKKVNEQDDKTKNEKEIIGLCDESHQTMTSDHWKDEQKKK